MTAALAPIAVMVGKLLRLLASDKPGEVIAAARALQRVLRSVGCDLHDLAQAIELSPPARAYEQRAAKQDDLDWRAAAKFCASYIDLLPDRERAFVRTMTCWSGEPSTKQRAWLMSIHERLRRRAA